MKFKGKVPVMKSDDYDASVVALAGEAKAKPLDRLKTDQVTFTFFLIGIRLFYVNYTP